MTSNINKLSGISISSGCQYNMQLRKKDLAPHSVVLFFREVFVVTAEAPASDPNCQKVMVYEDPRKGFLLEESPALLPMFITTFTHELVHPHRNHHTIKMEKETCAKVLGMFVAARNCFELVNVVTTPLLRENSGHSAFAFMLLAA